MVRPTSPALPLLTPLLALTLTVSACGGDDEDAAASPAATPTDTATSTEAPAGDPTADGAGTPTGTVATDEAPPPDADVSIADTVATGLEAPWSVAPLPGGDALVSLRDAGTIVRVSPDGTVAEVGAVPGVSPRGEGGLLGLALSPDYEEDNLVYAYYTTSDENRVVRMQYTREGLSDPEVVVDGIPESGIHNGGRIAFGPDGMLYVPTGDASREGLAQDPDSLGGKILRVTPEGEPAPDNPVEGSPVYSLGHRNVQGLAWDEQGRLWASEFGSDAWDELNLIEPGGNYGWPQVEGMGGGGDLIDPVLVWRPAEASPSGIAILGEAVYVASLRGERLWQVPIAGVTATPGAGGAGSAAAQARESVGEPREWLTGELGRLRTVLPAPEGDLWLVTNNTDGRGNPREGDDRILALDLT